MGDITAGMTGYSITYMSFLCIFLKRAVWACALSCIVMLKYPPPPLSKCFYKTGNFKTTTPPTDFFKWQLILVCVPAYPNAKKLEHFEF